MTSGPTADSWPPEIEGALIAHRKLLEILIAVLASGRPAGADPIGEIERRLGYQDQQEDPGFEPDRAFAVARAADAEMERLLRSARDIIAAADRQPNEAPSSIA
ncbi:hypothetical protein [Chthonobacter rhizosphaerae]|uniref:hypothetical protein n=1 Tax=Chthonobacter rhizosphaerae TaxID=2735553 RepID=UPI0015EE9BA0|nr:hypothetical protein [Chthonobacter rhizosphaerae]